MTAPSAGPAPVASAASGVGPEPNYASARPARRRGPRSWLAALPLSIKLPAIICSLLLIGITAFGFGANVALTTYLTRQVDDQLRSQVIRQSMRAPTDQSFTPDGGRGPTDYALGIVPDSANPSQIAWELPQGISASSGPAVSPAQTVANVGSELRTYTVPSQDGTTSWRAVSFQVQTTIDTVGTITIALPLTGVEGTLMKMRLVIVCAALPIVVIGSLAGYWLVRRSLRPLKQVESTAAAIAAGDLTQRVPPAPRGTEVGELTTSLNSMLTQIEQAFDAKAASESRMRQFVSDASHELRTPLASIRGYGELYRMGALPKKAEVSEAMRRIEQESTRMGSLVEDLLQLARLDEGRPLRRQSVDLTHVALDAAADAHVIAPDREIRVLDEHNVPLGADDAVIVVGDEDRVRQIVTNLLTNACRHTAPGTPIELLVSRTEQAGLLQVRDHGAGIPADQATRVFERFYRTDTSRTRASGSAGGSGLGLAIVASLVAAHGGGVDVIDTPGGGATFRVTLPLEPADSPASLPGRAPTPTTPPPSRESTPPSADAERPTAVSSPA